MKTKSKISGYIIRSAAYAVFFSVAVIALSLAFYSPEVHSMGRRRLSANPERLPSPSASLISERSKTFTGVTGSGQKRILIPSLRSMR